MNVNRRILIGVPTVVIFVSAVAWIFQDYVFTAGVAPAFRPDYAPATGSETQLMVIKNVDGENASLLLKSTERPQFFLYRPSGNIERVGRNEWARSSQRELDCWEQSTPDSYTGSSYGHYVLNAKLSPDGRRIAVLSAYGPKFPDSGGFIFGGTGRILGTRYLEIRETQDNRIVGKPFRIDISSVVAHPSLCWADGAQHVVVYNQAKDAGGNISVANVTED